ncbi:hypothetical protein HAX54_026034 [Datura stramonium]|uniref:Uncharacterized protein n=1 Tax=Datura stramonium TaxID=4076 RepID=A0ABS8V304_DATST|nr:hypothetical protein [Datura stramonium]
MDNFFRELLMVRTSTTGLLGRSFAIIKKKLAEFLIAKYCARKCSVIKYGALETVRPGNICYGLEKNNSWINNSNMIEKLKSVIRCIPVHWNRPSKVKTGGSFLQENEKAGIEGVLRNEYGDCIFAFSVFDQARSNNEAEAMTVKIGVE